MQPLIPMLAITGNPTNQQLTDMLDAYLRVGIDTVMLYPRSGLEVPYMSEAWRALCAGILEAAAVRDMHIWLYDEYNWPSGSCNNSVVREDPAFAARRFVCEGDTVRVETMTPGSAERVMEPFDNDMLNPAAVRAFIRLTHERYRQWFGRYFGNVIVGIFTDEPSYIYTANSAGMFPYYEGVREEYTAACGGGLEADMRAFMRGEETPHFPGVFRELVGKRFKSAYIDQIAAWCRENGLQLTGHTLEDDAPLEATRITGNWFSFMEELDVPGVDEIPTRLGTRDDILFAMIENIRRGGKRRAMAELFALGPCSMRFSRRRQMLWYAAAYGVNTFFIAISHLDAKGNVQKPDFFDNFNHFCPDFAGVRLLAEEAARAAAFADKRVDAAVGLRCPYTAYLRALGSHAEAAVSDTFSALVEQLTVRQIPWRMLREDEEADTAYIFSVDADGAVYTPDGAVFADAAAACGAVRHTGAQVTDAAGALLPQVLVRTYTDGSVAVIDRSNTGLGRRQCVLHYRGTQTPFILENEGVRIFSLPLPSAAVPSAAVAAIVPAEDVRLSDGGVNILRAVFLKETSFSFTVTAPLTVRLHRRCYPAAAGEVLLDGRAVTASQPCETLTGCFSSLYRSAVVTLPPGTHVLQTDMKDYPYLPAVLLEGDFEREGNELSPRREGVAHTFFGKLSVTAALSVPAGAAEAAVCLEDHGMLVEAFAEDTPLGMAAFAPYRFVLPRRLSGRQIPLRFTFYSTLAPLFGELAALMEQGIFCTAWRDVPAGMPEVLDIKALGIRGEYIHG